VRLPAAHAATVTYAAALNRHSRAAAAAILLNAPSPGYEEHNARFHHQSTVERIPRIGQQFGRENCEQRENKQAGRPWMPGDTRGRRRFACVAAPEDERGMVRSGSRVSPVMKLAP